MLERGVRNGRGDFDRDFSTIFLTSVRTGNSSLTCAGVEGTVFERTLMEVVTRIRIVIACSIRGIVDKQMLARYQDASSST